MRSIRSAERMLANGNPSPAKKAPTTCRKLPLPGAGESGRNAAMKKPSPAFTCAVAKEGLRFIAERGSKLEHHLGTPEDFHNSSYVSIQPVRASPITTVPFVSGTNIDSQGN